jgi:hypothetical protein
MDMSNAQHRINLVKAIISLVNEGENRKWDL